MKTMGYIHILKGPNSVGIVGIFQPFKSVIKLFLGISIFLEGAALQIGRSLVRFHLASLEFFIDIKSFRSHYGPRVDSASNRNEYQAISWG